MRARFQRKPKLELSPGSAVETAPPQSRFDDPRPLGRGVRFRAETRPLVGAGRNLDPRRDFEGCVETFELVDVIPLEMLAGFGPGIERRGEDSPVLDAILEIRDVRGTELEEELPDAPALGPRLECNVEIGFAD